LNPFNGGKEGAETPQPPPNTPPPPPPPPPTKRHKGFPRGKKEGKNLKSGKEAKRNPLGSTKKNCTPPFN